MIALLALARHGPRRSLELLATRAAPIFGALLAIAGALAAVRGLADFGLSRSLYDLELLIFVVAVPVVVLVADTRERAAWLLEALVAICAIAVALFILAEIIARAADSNHPFLADQEGEVGTGSFYAALCVAATLPLIVKRSQRGAPAALLAAISALVLIGLADKRSAWVALVASVAAIGLLARGHRRRLAVAAATGIAVLALTFVVDAATEAEGDGTVNIGGGRTYTPASGPLDGGFEKDTDGWLAEGNAQGELETTTDWSAAGARSLEVGGLATVDDQSVYAFACGTDATGMAIEPGRRYVASAIVRAGPVPAPGVRLGLVFYPGDGSFTSLHSSRSRNAVAAGQVGRLSVRSLAPAGAKIVGITIGPPPLSAGERTSFAVDRVTIRESGAGGDQNLSCGESSEGGESQVVKEARGIFGGSDTEGENVDWRLDYWRELLERLGEHPLRILTGAGFGPLEFTRENGSYDFRIAGSIDANNTSGPHNAFVGALYQMGIFGLIGLFGLFAVAAIRLFRAVRAAGDNWRAADVALAGMLVVSVAVIAFTEALRSAELALFVWTVVGLSLCVEPRPGSSRPRPSRAAGSRPPRQP